MFESVDSRTIVSGTELTYRISANSFRGNYSFLKLMVRPLFKGGKYSREETIVFVASVI